MADPPFVLLLVAPDEADRRRIGELLTDAQADVHWVTTAIPAALQDHALVVARIV
jgi:hypothetical protein